MKNNNFSFSAESWTCGICGKELLLLPVEVTYMGSSFPIELPRCPDCGFTLITADLALGKMLEVESILEDK